MNSETINLVAVVVLALFLLYGIVDHLRWLHRTGEAIRTFIVEGVNGSQMLVEYNRVIGESLQLASEMMLGGYIILRLLGHTDVAFYAVLGAVALYALQTRIDRTITQMIIETERKRLQVEMST